MSTVKRIPKPGKISPEAQVASDGVGTTKEKKTQKEKKDKSGETTARSKDKSQENKPPKDKESTTRAAKDGAAAAAAAKAKEKQQSSTSNTSNQRRSKSDNVHSYANTTEEEEESKKKTSISPAQVFVPPDVIAEASKGVKKDNIENDFFDPYFYKNQVAMRQHDPEKRKSKENATKVSNRDTGDESNLIRVIAKEVNTKGDKLCYITVKQLKFLGAGAFSDVFVGYVSKLPKNGKTPVDEHKIAVKKIWPDPSREDRQIGVHRHLDHPNIIKLRYYYVCVHPKTKMTMWTLLIDLMPSTITAEQSKYIDKGKIMPSLYIKLFMYQTFAALAYLEKTGYFHRDVKPENLLVCMVTGVMKIGDFGSAKKYTVGNAMSSYQVTRYYRAPELCMEFRYYDPTVDVWAAGCILAELLTNRIIFYGANNKDQLYKILRICGTPTMNQLKGCVPGHTIDEEILQTSFPPADWLKICRRYNPRTHSVAADFLQKVLRYERLQRLRGDDALRHKYFDALRANPKPLLPSGNPIPPLVGIDL